MQLKLIRMLLIISVLLFMQSCSVIEGIFKAGVGVGVFAVVAVIVVVIFLISKLISKK